MKAGDTVVLGGFQPMSAFLEYEGLIGTVLSILPNRAMGDEIFVQLEDGRTVHTRVKFAKICSHEGVPNGTLS